MDEKVLLHHLVDGPWIGIAGLVFAHFVIWLIRDFYKDNKYKKLREEQRLEYACRFMMKGETELDKFVCQFTGEDHSRISDSLLINKTNEIFIKELGNDQTRIVNSMERVADKVEHVARELRNETNALKKLIYRKGGLS